MKNLRREDTEHKDFDSGQKELTVLKCTLDAGKNSVLEQEPMINSSTVQRTHFQFPEL